LSTCPRFCTNLFFFVRAINNQLCAVQDEGHLLYTARARVVVG
jgi:hypothetical protein